MKSLTSALAALSIATAVPAAAADKNVSRMKIAMNQTFEKQHSIQSSQTRDHRVAMHVFVQRGIGDPDQIRKIFHYEDLVGAILIEQLRHANRITGLEQLAKLSMPIGL